MIRTKIISLFLFFSIPLLSPGQKQTAQWFFGDHAGLDFSSFYPRPTIGGQTKAKEGVSSVSDGDGNLLFYTDGATIWNREHQVMENGDSLWGHPDATQSALILQDPANSNQYYVITIDIQDTIHDNHGMRYSVVNMQEDSTKGAVIEKNSSWGAPATENVTAVRHANGHDYWVFSHYFNNGTFFIYQLTDEGFRYYGFQVIGAWRLHLEPPEEYNANARGYMKFSPRGNFFAQVVTHQNLVELYYFDRDTGIIDSLASIKVDGKPYGLEFSPTDNYFYVSCMENGNIYRWDLSDKTPNSVKRSRTLVNPNHQEQVAGALQLAFTGKIYVAYPGKSYLGVINSPNLENAQFYEQGASLIDQETGLGGICQYGLPNLPPDYFTDAKFISNHTCFQDTTLFQLTTLSGFEGNEPQWILFHENGTDTIGLAEVNPVTYQGTFTFPAPGRYFAELDALQYGKKIKERQEIIIRELPAVLLPDTTPLCAGSSITLDAGEGVFYSWQDNENYRERIRTVTIPGQYIVRVVHASGCALLDTTLVHEIPSPEVTAIIKKDPFCGLSNGQIEIKTRQNTDSLTFLWQEFPDSSGPILRQLPGGSYTINILLNQNGCRKTLLTALSELGGPVITIESDYIHQICPGTEITLKAEGATDYLWHNPAGNQDERITVRPYHSGTYLVEGFVLDSAGHQCSGFAELAVEVSPYQPPDLGEDLSVCEDMAPRLDGGERFLSWKWKNGDSLRFCYPSETDEEFWVHVTDQYGCNSGDTIHIELKPLPKPDLGPDRHLCMDHELALDAGEGDLFQWSTGATTREIPILEEGPYWVTVTTRGCSAYDEVNIQLMDPEKANIQDVMTRDVSCADGQDGSIWINNPQSDQLSWYSIDGGNSWINNDGVFNNLKSGGQYQVILWQDSVCRYTWPETITIEEPDPVSFNYELISPSCESCQDGQIFLYPSGGTAPYEIIWPDLHTGKQGEGFGLGTHKIWVIDDHQCKTAAHIEMVMGFGLVDIPNAFTPNGDGVNDSWKITSIQRFKTAVVQVFDRQGQTVFTSPPGYPEAWDGTANHTPVTAGTYYYIIHIEDPFKILKGSLTILR